jgi:hypothetical protein
MAILPQIRRAVPRRGWLENAGGIGLLVLINQNLPSQAQIGPVKSRVWDEGLWARLEELK